MIPLVTLTDVTLVRGMVTTQKHNSVGDLELKAILSAKDVSFSFDYLRMIVRLFANFNVI